jgi:nucleoside-diphosphate-sugar epimerase
MSVGSLRGARALVTGASGFLGSHLCSRLLREGADVHATSRTPREAGAQPLRWWQADLAGDGVATALLREIRPDYVFHLAGQVSAAPSAELVLPAFESLLGSTVQLLAAVHEVGCRRLVLTGSLTEPRPEGTDAASSPYAVAKWASSAYARMFHKLYGTPVVILRPFMAYGPNQHRDKLVPHVILSLLRGVAPRLASGRWAADWIYVDDVIDGFVLATDRDGIEGRDIDLGSGVLTTTRELVLRLAPRLASHAAPQFGVVPDRPDEQVRSADVAAAKALLGFEARISLDEGLERTIAWYRDQER